MNQLCHRCLSSSFPLLNEGFPRDGCKFCEGMEVKKHYFQRLIGNRISLPVAQVTLTPSENSAVK